jgi:hypothetical protein
MKPYLLLSAIFFSVICQAQQSSDSASFCTNIKSVLMVIQNNSWPTKLKGNSFKAKYVTGKTYQSKIKMPGSLENVISLGEEHRLPKPGDIFFFSILAEATDYAELIEKHQQFYNAIIACLPDAIIAEDKPNKYSEGSHYITFKKDDFTISIDLHPSMVEGYKVISLSIYHK